MALVMATDAIVRANYTKLHNQQVTTANFLTNEINWSLFRRSTSLANLNSLTTFDQWFSGHSTMACNSLKTPANFLTSFSYNTYPKQYNSPSIYNAINTTIVPSIHTRYV